MRLIWALLIPTGEMNASLSVNLLLSWDLFVFWTIFFLSHIPILLFPFVFYIPISLRYLASHRYINTSLSIIHAFTPTKNYSPKRQYFQYSFSIYYGVRFKNLTTCKTVSIETPTQHSIYDNKIPRARFIVKRYETDTVGTGCNSPSYMKNDVPCTIHNLNQKLRNTCPCGDNANKSGTKPVYDGQMLAMSTWKQSPFN